MRLWIFVLAMIWGLIACSPRGLTPQPPPTGSPVELKVDDIQIELRSAMGWQTYSSEDRIVLAHNAETSSEMMVNIWIPDINLRNYDSITEVAVDVLAAMQDEQDLFVTQPTPIDWNGYDAVYFLIGNDSPNTSMIVVLDTTNDVPIAMHIRGINEDFSTMRDALVDTFESFTVNGTSIGNQFFAAIPDTLNLPVRNQEAALDPSAEPRQD